MSANTSPTNPNLEEQKKSPIQYKSKEFIKEITKYFMDFLESDFHKHRNPRRSIKLHNEDNLVVGLNLNKYPLFVDEIWASVKESFGDEAIKKIEKGVYKVNIPANLLELINLQIEKINAKDVQKVISAVAKEIQEESIINKEEYDRAFNNTLENVSKTIKTTFVLPFLNNLEKPLNNMDLADENGIYLMEVELTDIITRQLEGKIAEILQRTMVKEKVNVSEEIKPILGVDELKTLIRSFFESFTINDLFAELYELIKNQSILDKQDFYLYFGDITFNKIKYPIFYIPFSVERISDSITINFDSQLYINKKALEFITQEYNNEQGKKGNLKTATERIIYINDEKETLLNTLQSVIDEITHFFNLDSSISLKYPEPQSSKSFTVRISNNIYFSLFDKADEALVNDYEEILAMLSSEEENILAHKFDSIIDDFINNDPTKFNTEVEEEWDSSEVSDKLVARSPIPLNSEQLQLLSALRKEGCNYITVEGPPGTGKSHTITAIAFDAILEKKSILVLSDKKEALDVVEDKITQTLNKVRMDENFQNPILRLGKTGSTYSQILASSAMESIKTNHRAVKHNYESVEEEIEKRINSLDEDLKAEIYSYKDIDIREVYEFFQLDANLDKIKTVINVDEVNSQEGGIEDLDELRLSLLKTQELITLAEDKNLEKFESLTGFSFSKTKSLSGIKIYLQFVNEILSVFAKLKDIYKNDLQTINQLGEISDIDIAMLEKNVLEFESEKNWLFGYSFKKTKARELDIKFNTYFPNSKFKQPHLELQSLKRILEIYKSAVELKKIITVDQNNKLDYIKLLSNFIFDENIDFVRKTLEELESKLVYIEAFKSRYPQTTKAIEIGSTIESIEKNKISNLSDGDYDNLLRYLSLMQKLSHEFNTIQFADYVNQKKLIEDLMITQMTYIMDGRLINFYENNNNVAKTIREIIKKKKKFPKESFSKLKEAFPCILAGIRDYAEYIPLEPEIFDLVIIDEASQVSIAQAFPALLRAKKVLILGDKKQFSNVKAAQARSDTNTEYLNNIKSSFIKHISNDNSKKIKLDKFNIKTSILDFFEFVHNYNIQLLKHFRGYKEIISYSNKYFYKNLQVMKIRGKRIDDVLKFKVVDFDGKMDLSPKTNSLEIDYIISELRKLKENGIPLSVGIITPHTNQQKLLVDSINKLPEKDYYFDKLDLKIMTFDTCQGEERDIIFYSMVATPNDDRLGYIFISDLSKIDIEEDGKIKAQRLNVGFSRAKEVMHFVLTKNPEDYGGEIGKALMHYKNTLEEAKLEINPDKTDPNSPMEKEVLNWFYQTNFWKNKKDKIEFFPQFEIGKYLRQLDLNYVHPSYKVDFLLVYNDPAGKEHKIIIEYDGFKEHFTEDEYISDMNYKDYYTDEHVYREKVLESYGYKFLRINKFNIGKNPIETLDSRIEILVSNRIRHNPVIENIHSTIEGLQNGKMRECPKCGELKGNENFMDSSLISGMGKFCNTCKRKSISTKTPIFTSESEVCPRCNSRMILRSGKFGRFYGCSKFPYCRGTRKLN